MRRRTLLAALGATSVAGVAGYAALDAPRNRRRFRAGPLPGRPGLVEVAPRSVEATVSSAGDSYSRTVPVFAEHVAFSMD